MFLTTSFVSAHDNITENIAQEEPIILDSTQNKTFTDLNNEINNINKTEIKLTNDYVYDDSD